MQNCGLAQHAKGVANAALLARIEALAARTKESCEDCYKSRDDFGYGGPPDPRTDKKKIGHRVLYMQSAVDDALLADLWQLTKRADVWGITDEFSGSSRLALRCLEYIEYMAVDGHSLEYHLDGETLLTMSIMLSSRGDFYGGAFNVKGKRQDGSECLDNKRASRGDLVLWRGWDDHGVAPVTHGMRRVLVAEWWCCSPADDATGPWDKERPESTNHTLRTALAQPGPVSAERRLKLGYMLFQRGELEAAKAALLETLELDGSNCQAHGILVYLHIAHRHFGSAFLSYVRAALCVASERRAQPSDA